MIQKTLVLIKPDGVLRGIVGEIIQRFERVGMKIVAIKMVQASKETLEQHYFKDEKWMKEKGELYKEKLKLPKETNPIPLGRNIVDGLIEDTQLSPIIAMVLEGHNAVNVVKKLTGPTNIEEALPGTIRGDFSQDTFALANKSNRPVITIIHATDDPTVAQKEIGFWFSQSEIYSYKKPEEDLHYRVRK
jgi:nucleoside-diphosphate kinase